MDGILLLRGLIFREDSAAYFQKSFISGGAKCRRVLYFCTIRYFVNSAHVGIICLR